MHTENFSTLLKAGEYYIGDPCYVLNDKQYFAFLEKLHTKEIYTLEPGVSIMAVHTPYGDGEFGDYPVDSGLIAIIPLSIIKDSNDETEQLHIRSWCGRIETLSKDSEVTIELDEYGNVSVESDDGELYVLISNEEEEEEEE